MFQQMSQEEIVYGDRLSGGLYTYQQLAFIALAVAGDMTSTAAPAAGEAKGGEEGGGQGLQFLIDRLELDRISLEEAIDVVREQVEYLPPPPPPAPADAYIADGEGTPEDFFLVHVLKAVVAQVAAFTETETEEGEGEGEGEV